MSRRDRRAATSGARKPYRPKAWRKRVKIDFNQMMLDGDKEPLQRRKGKGDDVELIDMTLGWACQNALWSARPQNLPTLTIKEQGDRYDLGERIGEGVVEIDDDDKELIRKALGESQFPLVAGQAAKMLKEPVATKASDKAE